MRFVLVALAIACGCPPLHAQSVESRFELDRKRFEQVYQAAHAGRLLDGQLHAIKVYPLAVYVEHAALNRRFYAASDAEIERFLNRWAGSYLGERVRNRYLARLAERGHWGRYRQWYRDVTPTTEQRCHYVHARLRQGVTDPQVIADGIKLWLVGKSQPDACDPVFERLDAQGELTGERRWQRARLALEAGQMALARYLVKPLNPQRQRFVETWAKAIDNPRPALNQSWPDDGDHRAMLIAVLSVYKRQDAADALRRWSAIRNQYTFAAHDTLSLTSALAVQGATDYTSDALAALDALSPTDLDANARAWQIRGAIHQRRFDRVLDLIGQLPADEREDARFHYWAGHAAYERGDRSTADAHFNSAAQYPEFFGFVAADRIAAPYAICPDQAPREFASWSKVQTDPSIERALEWLWLDDPLQARREWLFALRNADADFLLHAAKLAAQVGWHDRAIFTAIEAGAWRRYDLRFPLAFSPLVESNARRQRLPVPLVYGLIRAESAFQTDARSGAAAIGLMQMIATTARRTYRAGQFSIPSRFDLTNPAHNVPLGTAHMRELIDEEDHRLPLVLAAYNAGPTPMQRWFNRRTDNDALAFIETIPYFETRGYVPRILSFTVIYDWLLNGDAQRISSYLTPLDRPGRLQSPHRASLECPT